MRYYPLNYAQLNLLEGTVSPSTPKSINNRTFAFWSRAFFERAVSVLDFTLPKEWQGSVKDFFHYALFARGYLAIFYDPKFGQCFQPCTFGGKLNFYYQPMTVLISNPLLSTELEIGKECELLKLTPDYRGIWDIISYYAEKLAAADVAINSAIINSKFAYMIGGKNKAANEVMKKMFDKINQGEPAVFFDAKLANDGIDKEEPWQFLDRKVKDSYIVTDLLRDFQTILNNFDTEVGIPTIPYEKKERMVTSEAESRQIDATSRSVIWFDTLKQTFDIANSFMEFGSDGLKVELRYDLIKEGGAQDGQSEINTVRNV